MTRSTRALGAAALALFWCAGAAAAPKPPGGPSVAPPSIRPALDRAHR